MQGNFGLMQFVRVTIKSANRPIISHQTPKTATLLRSPPSLAWVSKSAVKTTLVSSRSPSFRDPI